MPLERKFPLDTIPNKAKIHAVEYYPDYSVICTIGKEAFYGTIEITFYPQETLLEFMSFEDWLRSLAMRETTIEELCRLVFDELLAALGDILLVVTVTAKTTVHAPVRATITSEALK